MYSKYKCLAEYLVLIGTSMMSRKKKSGWMSRCMKLIDVLISRRTCLVDHLNTGDSGTIRVSPRARMGTRGHTEDICHHLQCKPKLITITLPTHLNMINNVSQVFYLAVKHWVVGKSINLPQDTLQHRESASQVWAAHFHSKYACANNPIAHSNQNPENICNFWIRDEKFFHY